MFGSYTCSFCAFLFTFVYFTDKHLFHLIQSGLFLRSNNSHTLWLQAGSGQGLYGVWKSVEKIWSFSSLEKYGKKFLVC